MEENEILPLMEEEFPFIHLSPHTAKLMWQKQLRQVTNLKKHGQPHKSLKTKRVMEDAYKKQEALAGTCIISIVLLLLFIRGWLFFFDLINESRHILSTFKCDNFV